MNNKSRKLSNLVVFIHFIVLFSPVTVFAHHVMDGEVPTTFMQGVLSGFAHPIIGLDHLAFLLMAGVLSYSLKSPLRFIAPALFVLGSSLATSLYLSGVTVPGMEVMIALSIITAGAFVLLQRQIQSIPMTVLLTIAGLFHGYAYAEAIVGSETAPLVAYFAGLAVIQYAVIVATMIYIVNMCNPVVLRFAGSTSVVVGIYYLSSGLVIFQDF